MPHQRQFDFLDGVFFDPSAEVGTRKLLLESCQFPVVNESHLQAEGPRMHHVDINIDAAVVLEMKRHSLSRLQWIQTAWAILLRSYVGNDSVSFGIVPVRQDDTMVNHQLWLRPFAEASQVMACQLQISAEDMAIDTVQRISISKYPRHDFETSHINTAVTLPLSYPSRHRHREINHYLRCLHRKSRPHFDLILGFTEDENTCEITLNYKYLRIPTEIALNVVGTFEKILSEITTRANSKIGQVDCLSRRDWMKIQLWNEAQRLHPCFDCLHRVFECLAQSNPSAQAVSAWDGELTYSQLDSLSSIVARKLIDTGVRPGVYVPFAFEKSMWAVVATLGILKSGAAFVPLDPDHPVARVKDMVSSVNAEVVAASPSCAGLFVTMVKNVVVVSAAHILIDCPIDSCRFSSSLVCPQDPAFLLFTSGSTGRPKGIVHDHSSVVSNAFAHGRAMAYGEESRVLQFAAHTFDVAQMDIYTTLLRGGCVCIPSEEDRKNDIIGFINRMQVNWALLTPSFANLIDPDQVPSLHTLAFGGEALTKENIARWTGKATLMNCYGPAECGACLKLDIDPKSGRAASNVGFSLPNSICWLVHPDNHDQLVPIGAIGELLVEGPNLAKGYLNDSDRTKASFILDPAWTGRGGRPRRFYKSGDLLKYTSDGSMEFVGRKDTQVKLRGQRVELGEIEYHISTMPQIGLSVVAAPKSGCYMNDLVAVVQIRNRQSHAVRDEPLAVMTDTTIELHDIKAHVGSALPTYMLPTVCLVVNSLPFTASLKINRKVVNSWLEAMSTRVDSPLQTDSSISEDILGSHEVVASAISLEIAETISKNDRSRRTLIDGRNGLISNIGIDSIQMISLLMFLQRRYHVKVPLRVILNPTTTIRSLAQYIQASSQDPVYSLEQAGPSIDDEVATMSHQLTDWMADHALDVPEKAATSYPVHNVLLTGATGFLGLNILRELLVCSQVSVIALVRTSTASEGLQRLVNSARKARWWCDVYSQRLIVWAGDISLPRLGLSKIHWQQLSGLCDPDHAVHAIIHNGARVHWNSDYSALKPVNVGSTLELLKAASASRALSRFSYVSGGQSPDDDDLRLDASTDPVSPEPNTNGYSQSKKISESLVIRYAQLLAQCSERVHHPQHISVIKPGYIIGTAEDGIANQSDFLWRLVAACIDIKAYSYTDDRCWLFVSDVGRVSMAVVDSTICCMGSSTTSSGSVSGEAGQERSGEESSPSSRVSSAANSTTQEASVIKILDGLPFRTFWSILSEEFGYDIEPVPHNEWVARMEDVVTAKGQSHVFFPFLHAFEREEEPPLKDRGLPSSGGPVSASNCGNKGSGDGNGGNSGRAEAAVRRNLKYLIQVGFLPAPRE